MTVPADLQTEQQREAYRRGWNDRASKLASRAGKTTSDAKAEAARLNGAKGGRPPKDSAPKRPARPRRPAK